MRVYSFIDDQFKLIPVEVEISLLPGLPDLKILGLPDALIKESAERIKSAIKFQGYQWPKSQKILVQLKPNDIRKSSRGLDLAIAAGILAEMQQINLCSEFPILYGELSLKGEVGVPKDAIDIDIDSSVFTGISQNLPFPSAQISELNQIEIPTLVRERKLESNFIRPKLNLKAVSECRYKELLVIAAGEHNSLFVGSPGAGKTTSAQLVARCLRSPEDGELRETERTWRRQGEKLKWRPIVSPHHTSSHIAVVGGGKPPAPGEISRAHGGVLILDELLEFKKNVQEALREPVENKKIRISRSGGVAEFPSDFLLLATSNLCPCGQFVPRRGHKCRCRHKSLVSYLEKFSGPILDRFAITLLFEAVTEERRGGDDKKVSTDKIIREVENARSFAANSRGQTEPNSKADVESIFSSLKSEKEKETVESLIKGTSYRRRVSLLQVARTLADVDASKSINLSHIESAKKLTLTNFRSLQEDVFKYI